VLLVVLLVVLLDGVGSGVREVESREKQSTAVRPWDAGSGRWAAQQGATGPLAASPRPCNLGCGRAAGMPRRERFAHGEGNGHT
jgi:hypothetical protein